MRTSEERRLIERAEKLADMIDNMITGKTVLNTELVIALNEFRMAQVQADDQLYRELEDMLAEYEENIKKSIVKWHKLW